MSYSIDLRKKVLKYVEEGGSVTEAARLFDISRPAIYQWIKKKSAGSLEDQPPKRPWRKINPEEVIAFVEKHSDLTLAEYGEHFGIKASSMFNVFKRLKISRKKKTISYKERDEHKRAVFLQQIASFPKESLVFVDESGIDSFIFRSHGWSKRGHAAYGNVSGKRFYRESFIAAKCSSKILAPLCFQGTCYTKLFEMWIEKFLAPELKPGQVVIMDNATFHKSKKTQELIEQAQCKLIFLPPYSPESILN